MLKWFTRRSIGVRSSAEDLSEGLFLSACCREHALNPGSAGEFNPLQVEPEYAAAHQFIKAAILQAGAAGRAEWHNGSRRARSPWSTA